MKKIGYVSIALGVPDTNMRATTLKYATESRLLELIGHNLDALERIIEYNVRQQIKLFRISSDLIPFGSSPANALPWWNIFDDKLSSIGELALKNGIRLSMHPGQYTVLNSPHEDVVKRAIEDLLYHVKVLEALQTGPDHKIVLHIGGIYNDKAEAIRRFSTNYRGLNECIKKRLIIENDDRCYTISDALEIGKTLDIPVVFDNLHHHINPAPEIKSEADWIRLCADTWGRENGRQKIHYSQQDQGKKAGAHTATIAVKEFLAFYENLAGIDLDIMLEVKDKNLSAIKCINCLSTKRDINLLRREWNRYKYSVLERSPVDYEKNRSLLSRDDHYPVVTFYGIIENALQKEAENKNAIDALQHVWGYLMESSTDKEKTDMLKILSTAAEGKTAIKTVKNRLWKLALKYNKPFLLESYFFLL